ncbi:MAG: transposase [Acetobacteraceae bacterium]|nr:transposase [Acetobacteraceae bacterium]
MIFGEGRQQKLTTERLCRYASDLIDAEWTLMEPHIPAAKRFGRPRETALRTVLEAIL